MGRLVAWFGDNLLGLVHARLDTVADGALGDTEKAGRFLYGESVQWSCHG